MNKKIIVALDYPDIDSALSMAKCLDPNVCRVKVGKELYTAAGPAVIERLHLLGFEVFLDLKFHDIPNTVAAACEVAAKMGVWMVNVHALGGHKMMATARERLEKYSQRPLLIAVTILTSMSEDELHAIGIQADINSTVLNLSSLARQAGLDGVVCSAQESTLLRDHHGTGFKMVTPGIRPEWASKGDQQRVMTPAAAVQAGIDYMVIGRPITQADAPVEALDRIQKEIETA
jgi:orotidine-5'-phosphate decarboxylase